MPPALPIASDPEIPVLASEILSRPEYARYRAPDDAWVRQLVELLERWLRFVPELRAEAPAFFWALLLVLLLVLAFLVAHIVWSLRAALRPPPPAAPAPDPTRRDFAGGARELASRGAYLEASHQLLLASLAHAAEARLLSLRPEDSNRRVCEKLRRARLDPALRETLVGLIRETDAMWFGHRRGGEALYGRWQVAFAQLTRGAR